MGQRRIQFFKIRSLYCSVLEELGNSIWQTLKKRRENFAMFLKKIAPPLKKTDVCTCSKVEQIEQIV